MRKALQAIGSWLQVVGHKPARTITPAMLSTDIERVGQVSVDSHSFSRDHRGSRSVQWQCPAPKRYPANLALVVQNTTPVVSDGPPS
jgi:hypothetical protein